MKILFLPKSPDATKTYRTDIPGKYLAAAGHEVKSRYAEVIPNIEESGIREDEVEWADVLVFQRP